jgi:hypothetical protein
MAAKAGMPTFSHRQEAPGLKREIFLPISAAELTLDFQLWALDFNFRAWHLLNLM